LHHYDIRAINTASGLRDLHVWREYSETSYIIRGLYPMPGTDTGLAKARHVFTKHGAFRYFASTPRMAVVIAGSPPVSFDEMKSRYGVIEGYFSTPLKIDAAGQKALRERFLTRQ
jgi:hypothetical protein